MAYQYAIRVRFNELDPYDHVNHAVYLTYCETARIELLNEIEWGMAELESNGLHIVVTDMDIKFRASAGLEDTLVVETEVHEIRRSTMRWRQRIFRGEKLVVELALRAAITDLEGKPVRIPEGFALALEPHLVSS